MAGIASRRSMMQYAAVARMRMQMLGHSVRTGRGQFDIVAAFATWASYLFMGTVFAVAFGVGADHILRKNNFDYLSLLIWAALLMWQLTPIMAISFREEQDLSGLARYPLGFGAFYILFLFFGFFDLSTIFGMAALLGIFVGACIARAALLPVLLIGLALFAAFNIFLNRAIFAWLSRWLAQRRSREILGVVFFVIVIAAELLNPAMHQFSGRVPVSLILFLKVLEPLNSLLPPGLISGGVQGMAGGHLLHASASLAGMVAWTILPAAILGLRLHAQYRGESLSEAPAHKAEAAPTKASTHSTGFEASGPIAAVMVKEARYLIRSYQLLYGLVAPLILMLIFTGTPNHHNSGALVAPQRFLFPLGVFYAVLGLTRLIFNSLGGEGTGLQFYFISPVPFWKVILGKNLFHLILMAVEIIALWIFAMLRGGPPTAEAFVLTLCAMTFIVPAEFLAANLIALHMPYRMNLSRLGRAQGATANNLLSLLSQLAVCGICAIVYFATISHGGPWVTGIVFLILGGIACAAYWMVLQGIGRQAQNRIEILLNDLARTAS